MAFSGFQDFRPAFADALQQMMAAQSGISINSGYRSIERQKFLWDRALKKYGSAEAADNWVAPPGRSQHNFGTAADLGFASPAARTWAHENAGRFGLTFPMAHEPWHVELAGARSSGNMGAQPGVVGQAAPPSLSGIGSPDTPNYFGTPPAPPSIDLQRPFDVDRFLMGMIAGENPLRSMVFQGIGRALGIG